MSHYAQFVVELTILVLAIFLGIEVISKVPTLLHTPLMSGTNAIHGIVIVGALVIAGAASSGLLVGWIGFVAMILASANVVGGFVVTDRMLEMFKRREPPKKKDDEAGDCSEHRPRANLLYLVTIICFILALRFLSSPTTARRGNWVGAFGMAWAIGVTLARPGVHLNWQILVGAAIGAAFGAVGARKVKMTAMPQMVALFNGVGGGAAALISLAELHLHLQLPHHVDLKPDISVAIVLSALIGSVSFAGSMVAFAKLQELLSGRPITYPGQQFVNLILITGRHRVRRGAHRRLRASVGARRAAPRLAGLRRALRAADRRGGHAGRDLAAERVHGPRGGRDGLRARLERADRERRPRRGLGNVAHDDDGAGDEPLDRERALRRVRPGSGGRRYCERGRGHGAGAHRRGRRDPALVRAEGRDRARVRDGGRAGPARGARAGGGARGEGDRGHASRSTRSRAGCRAT